MQTHSQHPPIANPQAKVGVNGRYIGCVSKMGVNGCIIGIC